LGVSVVECAFGILANKWRILHCPIAVNVDVAEKIFRACCDNFVRKNDGTQFEEELYACPMSDIEPVGIRSSRPGIDVRYYFSNYFISPQGSLS